MERGFSGVQKENVKKLGTLVLLRMALVFGWTLLFILPGIWKAYLYSQAANILKEDKTLSPMEALNKSEEVMKANVWNDTLVQLIFLALVCCSSRDVPVLFSQQCPGDRSGA
ncbi:MAG: hypothetical protein U5K84_10410 [Alkalibacterium sp.]|nr:hypothetical protein [Alkalibacterium sp.]